MSKSNHKKESHTHSAHSSKEGNPPLAPIVTSGSEFEFEQRVLLKGNVVAARNSLLDFV